MLGLEGVLLVVARLLSVVVLVVRLLLVLVEGMRVGRPSVAAAAGEEVEPAATAARKKCGRGAATPSANQRAVAASGGGGVRGVAVAPAVGRHLTDEGKGGRVRGRRVRNCCHNEHRRHR